MKTFKINKPYTLTLDNDYEVTIQNITNPEKRHCIFMSINNFDAINEGIQIANNCTASYKLPKGSNVYINSLDITELDVRIGLTLL